MIIDTGPKFYSSSPPTYAKYLKVKVTDLEIV